MFKRGQNTTPTLVARNALSNLPMCASLKTPSQKPNGKKGMEKRTHTILGLHITTLVTLPSSAGNYLQVPCTCFALCAASDFASRVNVVDVLVIDACYNIFKLSYEHRTIGPCRPTALTINLASCTIQDSATTHFK
jgi:hypothetical protein